MEKPAWRRRRSEYVVESPFMRLRRDEIELPDGRTILDYFVRESYGFTIVAALTPERQVVLVREYRYGSDRLHLELPAGTISAGEAPLACAQRELAEETGYTSERFEALASYYAEPVRSDALGHVFLAHDARPTRPPARDPGEHMEVELVSLERFRSALVDGTFDTAATLSAGYRLLDRLGTFA